MTAAAASPKGLRVTSLRRLLLDHRALAAWLLALALAVRLLVPAGYMIDRVDGRPVLAICSGYGPVRAAPMAMTMPMAHAGAGHDAPGEPHPVADSPCPFGALAQAVALPVVPLLLALAIAFAMALAMRPHRRPVLPDRIYLRPPLRGPPRPA